MAGQEFKVPVGEGGISALRTGPESGSGDCFIYAPRRRLKPERRVRRVSGGAVSGVGVGMCPVPVSIHGGRPSRPRLAEGVGGGVAAGDRDRRLRGIQNCGRRAVNGWTLRLDGSGEGAAVDALALFAYPLHPPGNPERPRDGHFPNIMAPTFFCSGTRDSFGTPDELRAAAADVPDATLHFLEGADHGFAVPTLHRPHPKRRVGRGGGCVLGVVAG